ncbi:hypothetical protein BDV93DRAFT_482731 [Ceratobasidium sp. AG-I]|nr:hypothetical protein BDV93DRAFT_482731 [Ceratobasidium sp. AG-I]
MGARKLLIQVFDDSKIRVSGNAEPVQSRTLGQATESDLRTPEEIKKLIHSYLLEGKWEQAEKLQWKTTESMQKSLGNNHSITRESMVALVGIYLIPDLLSELESVVDAERNGLGHESPGALMNMHKLELVYFNLDRLADAEQLGMIVLDARRRVLGEGDPDTVTSKRILALVYQALKEDHKAKALYVEMFMTKNIGSWTVVPVPPIPKFPADLQPDEPRLDRSATFIRRFLSVFWAEWQLIDRQAPRDPFPLFYFLLGLSNFIVGLSTSAKRGHPRADRSLYTN